MQADAEERLRVVALLVGEPRALELWSLKRLFSTSCELYVVRALKGTGLGAVKRLKSMARQHGVLGLVSRLAASRFIAPREERKKSRQLDLLLDGDHLREWWRASGINPIDVPHLNHADARSVIAKLRPDVMVRVSGGILYRRTFSLARITTLNIHHGVAPRIRGMWSISWGIIEGRDDWIGATLHEIDDGIDTGRVLWRGSPQLAPGDTGITLLFRIHLEAIEALIRVIRQYQKGEPPTSWPCDDQGQSDYRSAPDMWAWLRYIYLGRGKRAPIIFERAWKAKPENSRLYRSEFDGSGQARI